ncbi:EAL domain-containing protein, partial [Escherichia coli]|uniref:EAL domain-containing protein n=1 Tax=Escherichia coli TaxID=562 RepID=UPI002FE428A0
ALAPQHGNDRESVIRNADTAMYTAKENGRGKFCVFSPEMNQRVFEYLWLDTNLRKALDNDQLLIHYQPKVTWRGEVRSLEALVRWPRRPGGEIGPDTFITIAETSGLIYKLGQFVLQRACRDMVPFSELKLSVNISPAQFRDPEFENKVAQVLDTTSFPANRLQLEVTETYVLENPERARMAIANLKALGTAVALDDFGTGYSS